MHRFAFLLLALPFFVSADAGFARSSLWLSSQEITEGQSATLYASLSNTGEKLDGEVSFLDNGTQFGKVSIALAPGEGRIISVSWKPAEGGTHALKAILADAGGKAIDELSIAVVVQNKPATEQEAKVAAAIESSDSIQKAIAEYVPQASGIANPVFEKLDSLRGSGTVFLDGQIAEATQKLEETKSKKEVLAKAKVLGAESDDAKSEDRKLTVTYLLNTLLLYTLSVIRFALSHAAVFYPLIAIIILGGLWKAFQRIRNPVRYASDI
jgi:hypothetical protein